MDRKTLFSSVTVGLLILSMNACSWMQPSEPAVTQVETAEEVAAKENPVPGTVTGNWPEPMVDTVRVPAQLDPTGTYYRPTHRTVVEIRPGRYQEAQYPPDSE